MVGDVRNLYRILAGKHESKNHSEDLGIDRRVILEWNLEKLCERIWTGFI
jgi:hypothetical protein